MNGVFVWNADTELFSIGNFPLRYYGILFALGLILGYNIVKYIYSKEKIPVQQLDNLIVYIVIGTVLGARLGHCLFYDFEYYSQHPIEILLPIQKIDGNWEFVGFQGLASHGGAIGVLICIGLYCKKYQVNMLWLLDRLAIAIPVACAFIRFGNFMNSEIYGKPTDGTWGVIFKRDDMIPRHPTQLYEAFSYLAVTIILILFYKNKKHVKGFLFGWFLILMFVARFIIEFSKENQEAFEDEMIINMGQWLSIPFIVAGILLLVYAHFKTPRTPNLETT